MIQNTIIEMSETRIEYLIHLLKRIKSKIYTKLLSPSFFDIGCKSSIIPPLRFGNLSQIQLGKGVTIHSNCWIQVVSGEKQPTSPKIIIHNYTAIGMNATISAVKKIVIKEHVFTGRNVYISDHGHEFQDTTKPIAAQDIGKIAEVRIGAYTWLGQNSVILPGVTIGMHCVIGANSVVSHDIPDYSVAVGAPARVIKAYNNETQCWERIQTSE